LIAIKSLIVVLVSVDRVCVGATSPSASVSLRSADASTTGIPALIAASKDLESLSTVLGSSGVALIAASSVVTCASTALRTLSIEAASRWVRVGVRSTSDGLARAFIIARGKSDPTKRKDFIMGYARS
jgi:hypothetical protein